MIGTNNSINLSTLSTLSTKPKNRKNIFVNNEQPALAIKQRQMLTNCYKNRYFFLKMVEVLKGLKGLTKAIARRQEAVMSI